MPSEAASTDGAVGRLWLSTQKMMRYINRTHSFTYNVTKQLTGGYGSRAFLITDPDSGSQAVLKWNRKTYWAARIMSAAHTVEQARDLGWPTPRWLAKGISPSGYPYVIQEYIDPSSGLCCGGPMDDHTMRAAIHFLDTHKGVGAKLESTMDWLTSDQSMVFNIENHAEHTEAIQACSQDGAEIVDIFKCWQEKFHAMNSTGRDLVHGDFHPGNIFFSGDSSERKAEMVIDVEALGIGSRFHDVADLAVHCFLWNSTPEALQVISSYVHEQAAPGEWEISLAARCYQLLAFATTHFSSERSKAVLRRTLRFLQAMQDRSISERTF